MPVNLKDALASPVLASVAQGAFSIGATRAQRKWSEKMYNKYNSPEALVRQYNEAGINPALMFGQSPIAAPTASEAATTPDNFAGDVVGMLGALMQLDLLDANKRSIEADIENKQADTHGKNISNTFQPEILRQSLERGQVDIQQARLSLKRTTEEINKLVAETHNIGEDSELKAAQRLLVFAQRALVKMQTDESFARIGEINANTLLIGQKRFAEELDNLYRKEFGVSPSAGMSSQLLALVRGSALTVNRFAVSQQEQLKSDLRKLGAEALKNAARMSKNARLRWQYNNSSLR